MSSFVLRDFVSSSREAETPSLGLHPANQRTSEHRPSSFILPPLSSKPNYSTFVLHPANQAVNVDLRAETPGSNSKPCLCLFTDAGVSSPPSSNSKLEFWRKSLAGLDDCAEEFLHRRRLHERIRPRRLRSPASSPTSESGPWRRQLYFSVPKGEKGTQFVLRRVAPRRVWLLIAFGASVACLYEHISRLVCLVVCKNHRL